MEWQLQCLGPVHIGTGQKIEPFEYILKDQRYIRVNIDAMLERMSPEEAEQLAVWVNERADNIAGANGRRASELKRETTLDRFAQGNPDLLNAVLEDEGLSSYRAQASLQRVLEVTEQVKDADRRPLIPGSSIKGAIRTALAYAALAEMDAESQADLRREMENALGRRPRKDAVGQVIEKAVFRCGHRRRGQVTLDDIQYDLMRCIRVSDTMTSQAELLVGQAHTFVKDRDGGLAAQAPLQVEMHAPGNAFRVRLEVDAALLQAMVKRCSADEWVGIRNKVERAFGAAARGLLDGDTAALEDAIRQHVSKSCRRFYQAVAEAEGKWAQAQQASPLVDFYNRLDTLNGGSMPLRLGWGSHFMATTLLMALRSNAVWRGVMEQFMHRYDLGVPPRRGRQGGRREIRLDDFPSSRRLVSVRRRPMAPFGWVAMVPVDEALPGAMVAVDEIMQRQQDRGASGGRGGRFNAGGGRGPSRPPQREMPPQRETPAPSMRAALRELARSNTAAQSVRRGQRVNVEVLENDGRRVRVRVLDGQDEEIRFSQVGFPHQAGARCKMKVMQVDSRGKITRLAP